MIDSHGMDLPVVKTQECPGDRYTYSYEKYEWGIILRAGLVLKKNPEKNWTRMYVAVAYPDPRFFLPS